MTYSRVHGAAEFQDVETRFGSREFFDQSDREFLKWNQPLHGHTPFSQIFPYTEFRSKKVLEIGCGMGLMSSLWALSGATVTSVDLNFTSVRTTSMRFEGLGIQSRLVQADARNLPLGDSLFDYVFSWGVLHHSPNLDRSISELARVLKPGGEFGIMLYNRNSILHWYMTRYLEGFVHLESRFLNDLELSSRYGDGARDEGNPYTRPVTRREVKSLCQSSGLSSTVRTLGTDLDSVLVMMAPGLGKVLPRRLKKPLARRWGWSLWISGRKI